MQAHTAPAHPVALAILHILFFRSCQLWPQEGRVGDGELGVLQSPSSLHCPLQRHSSALTCPASKANTTVCYPMETNSFTSLREIEPQSDRETLRVTSLSGGWTQKSHTHQSHSKLFPGLCPAAQGSVDGC